MSRAQGGVIRRGLQRRFNFHRRYGVKRMAARQSHDSLTGLPSRSWLQNELDACLQNSAAAPVAVMVLGLDDFHSINVSAGHAHGDALLAQFVCRLRSMLPDGTLLARLGGDVFCVALFACNAATAYTLGRQVVRSFSAPFDIDGVQRYSCCSIGLAVSSDEANTSEQLIRHADMALHQAKKLGRGTLHPFDPKLLLQADTHLELQALLRVALRDGNQFSLHLQPQFDLLSGDIVGVEALLRWIHPQRGEISPNTFIPAAESGGLIAAIGDWVLAEACRIARLLWDGGWPICVAINLSALQLRKRDLVRLVGEALAQENLPPEAIEIELTESCLIEDEGVAAETIAQFLAMGVRTTIDDFGTGFSSLSYLCALPVRAIKIDRSFVRQMTHSQKNERLVKGLIRLAHSLELSVLAEGVETEQQMEMLRRYGCDAMQGWLASKALPLCELIAYLQNKGLQNVLAVERNGELMSKMLKASLEMTHAPIGRSASSDHAD